MFTRSKWNMASPACLVDGGFLLLHTGLISSRSFQNYAFKGWLSPETMKLCLLVLTKKLFFIELDYKTDIGQHFHKKVGNLPGGATFTKYSKGMLKLLYLYY